MARRSKKPITCKWYGDEALVAIECSKGSKRENEFAIHCNCISCQRRCLGYVGAAQVDEMEKRISNFSVTRNRDRAAAWNAMFEIVPEPERKQPAPTLPPTPAEVKEKKAKEANITAIEAQLRPLITAYIKGEIRTVGHFNISERIASTRECNFGIWLSRIERADNFNFRLWFAMGDTLRAVHGIDATAGLAEFNILYDAGDLFQSIPLTNESHVDVAIGKTVSIYLTTRRQILSTSTSKTLLTIANNLGPVVTQLALEGHGAQ